MAFGTFEVVTPEDQSVRWAEKVTTPAILDPLDATAVEQGEWLNPDSTGKTYERVSGTPATAAGPVIAYPVASPKGSTDVQAIRKVELYIDWEIADTTCYESATYTVGEPLCVNTVTIDGVSRAVLVKAIADFDYVQAEVITPPTDATTYTPMRIRRNRYTLSV